MQQQFKFILVLLFLTAPSLIISQSITKEKIENAEKIIDLKFTDAERDSMLGYLEEQKGNYDKIRNVELNNSIMPSLLFNPIPVGFMFTQGSADVKFSDYSNTVMPSNKDELAFYTIGQLAELIRTKQITSSELTKFFIDRLKSLIRFFIALYHLLKNEPYARLKLLMRK